MIRFKDFINEEKDSFTLDELLDFAKKLGFKQTDDKVTKETLIQFIQSAGVK